jgi:hypothetical protein
MLTNNTRLQTKVRLRIKEEGEQAALPASILRDLVVGQFENIEKRKNGFAQRRKGAKKSE